MIRINGWILNHEEHTHEILESFRKQQKRTAWKLEGAVKCWFCMWHDFCVHEIHELSATVVTQHQSSTKPLKNSSVKEGGVPVTPLLAEELLVMDGFLEWKCKIFCIGGHGWAMPQWLTPHPWTWASIKFYSSSYLKKKKTYILRGRSLGRVWGDLKGENQGWIWLRLIAYMHEIFRY